MNWLKMRLKWWKGNAWVLGDFKLPRLEWTNNIPSLKSDCAFIQTYDTFLGMLNDISLVQMTTRPTRRNILDLFLTKIPTLVNDVSCYPGLGENDMVIAKCAIKPVEHKLKPRKVRLFRKADWPTFKMLMKTFMRTEHLTICFEP